MRYPIDWSRINHSLSPDWSLSEEEVQKRRAQYGANDIAGIKSNLWYELLVNTLSDPMIWFLLLTSTLFAFLHNYQ